MKTFIISSILFIVTLSVQAQVGINNQNPTEGLDIQGSLQVRKEIRVGPTAAGDPGKAGQILISKGDNLPPRWLSFPDTKNRLAQVLSKNLDEVGQGYIYGPIVQPTFQANMFNNIKNMFVDNGTAKGSNNPSDRPVPLIENK